MARELHRSCIQLPALFTGLCSHSINIWITAMYLANVLLGKIFNYLKTWYIVKEHLIPRILHLTVEDHFLIFTGTHIQIVSSGRFFINFLQHLNLHAIKWFYNQKRFLLHQHLVNFLKWLFENIKFLNYTKWFFVVFLICLNFTALWRHLTSISSGTSVLRPPMNFILSLGVTPPAKLPLIVFKMSMCHQAL